MVSISEGRRKVVREDGSYYLSLPMVGGLDDRGDCLLTSHWPLRSSLRSPKRFLFLSGLMTKTQRRANAGLIFPQVAPVEKSPGCGVVGLTKQPAFTGVYIH